MSGSPGSQTKNVYTVLWSLEKKQWHAVKVDDPSRPRGAGWSLWDNYWHAHADACRRNEALRRNEDDRREREIDWAKRRHRLKMTNVSPFFEFVLLLVVPGALVILIAALLWTGET